jgi:hypothetical protein
MACLAVWQAENEGSALDARGIRQISKNFIFKNKKETLKTGINW